MTEIGFPSRSRAFGSECGVTRCQLRTERGNKVAMLGKPAGVRLLVCALACVVGACAGPRGCGTPAPIELVISAERQLNPDEEGHSLPTTLRIYQLKGAEKLEPAEFDQIYRNEKETLGETLLRVDEIALSPGGSLRKLLPRDPAAHA